MQLKLCCFRCCRLAACIVWLCGWATRRDSNLTKVKASLAGGKSIKVRHLSADKAIPLSIASPYPPTPSLYCHPVSSCRCLLSLLAMSSCTLRVARCALHVAGSLRFSCMESFACRSSLLGATFEQLQAFVNKRIIHISCRVLLDSSSFIIFTTTATTKFCVRCALAVLLLKN